MEIFVFIFIVSKIFKVIICVFKIQLRGMDMVLTFKACLVVVSIEFCAAKAFNSSFSTRSFMVIKWFRLVKYQTDILHTWRTFLFVFWMVARQSMLCPIINLLFNIVLIFDWEMFFLERKFVLLFFLKKS